MSRWARRTDTTHALIRLALRQAFGEANVIDAHRWGDDFPDLIVAVKQRVVLVECKTPTRNDGGAKPSKTSVGQRTFAAAWQGGPIVTATSAEQAVSLVNEVLRHL